MANDNCTPGIAGWLAFGLLCIAPFVGLAAFLYRRSLKKQHAAAVEQGSDEQAAHLLRAEEGALEIADKLENSSSRWAFAKQSGTALKVIFMTSSTINTLMSQDNFCSNIGGAKDFAVYYAYFFLARVGLDSLLGYSLLREVLIHGTSGNHWLISWASNGAGIVGAMFVSGTTKPVVPQSDGVGLFFLYVLFLFALVDVAGQFVILILHVGDFPSFVAAYSQWISVIISFISLGMSAKTLWFSGKERDWCEAKAFITDKDPVSQPRMDELKAVATERLEADGNAKSALPAQSFLTATRRAMDVFPQFEAISTSSKVCFAVLSIYAILGFLAAAIIPGILPTHTGPLVILGVIVGGVLLGLPLARRAVMFDVEEGKLIIVFIHPFLPFIQWDRVSLDPSDVETPVVNEKGCNIQPLCLGKKIKNCFFLHLNYWDRKCGIKRTFTSMIGVTTADKAEAYRKTIRGCLFLLAMGRQITTPEAKMLDNKPGARFPKPKNPLPTKPSKALTFFEFVLDWLGSCCKCCRPASPDDAGEMNDGEGDGGSISVDVPVVDGEDGDAGAGDGGGGGDGDDGAAAADAAESEAPTATAAAAAE